MNAVNDRPDGTSAMADARASGHRVEDLSERSETTQVFANPDGSWTSEEAASPVRTQDHDGNWSDVDLTLEKVAGGYAPASALGGLVVSDGGDQTFAAMNVDGRDLDWKWPDALPQPTVEGNTATYANVVADGDGDLVVTATASGFRHDIVLHEAPADPVAFDIPVVTAGPKISEEQNGNLTVETKSGDELVSAAPPVMYDAADPQTGESEHVAPVDTTVTQSATGGVVTLDPDEGFLNDPSTVYPVTIDPTFNSTNPDDTWISNTAPNSVHPNDDTLYVGTPDAGTTKYRSYIRFNGNQEPWEGGIVSSATLTLRNFYSSACSGAAAGVEVRRVAGSWEPGSSTWNSQPTTSTTYAVRHGTAYGATGCPTATDVSWNVTGMVQEMASWAANYGFRVAGYDETKTGTYRKYRSANYYSSPIPRLSVTYSAPPPPPSNVVVKTDTGSPMIEAVLAGELPTDQVRMKAEILSGANVVTTLFSDWVPSGASVVVPVSGLPNGSYVLRLLV